MKQICIGILITISLMTIPLATVITIIVPGIYWYAMLLGFIGIISVILLLILYDKTKERKI